MRDWPDVYIWVAHYADGSTLPEADGETGVEHAFSGLELTRLVALELVPLVPGFPALRLEIDPARQRPVYFRRQAITVDLATGEQRSAIRYALGWQATVAGRRVLALTVVREDGSVLVTGSREGW